MKRYPHSIAVKLSDAELEKIKESGLSISEYIRMSIDTFNSEKITELIDTQIKEYQKAKERYMKIEEDIDKEISSLEQKKIQQNTKEETITKDETKIPSRVQETLWRVQKRNELSSSRIKQIAKINNIPPANITCWIKENEDILQKNIFKKLYFENGKIYTLTKNAKKRLEGEKT